jgi:membrane protein involved in colicin uptake
MARRASADKRAAERRARSDERKADVADKLSRLKGSTKDDLFDDRSRGATSPIGMGTGAKKRR